MRITTRRESVEPSEKQRAINKGRTRVGALLESREGELREGGVGTRIAPHCTRFIYECIHRAQEGIDNDTGPSVPRFPFAWPAQPSNINSQIGNVSEGPVCGDGRFSFPCVPQKSRYRSF